MKSSSRLAPIILAAMPCAVLAQSPWVFPQAYVQVGGSRSGPFALHISAYTYQKTLPGADFVGAPGDAISGFTVRTRFFGAAGSWPNQDAQFDNYDVFIAELATPLGPLQPIVADNVVPGTEIQVRGGPMTIPAHSFTGDGTLPNPFGNFTIEFDVPFNIDPAKDYVMTIRHTGNQVLQESFDCLPNGNSYAARRAASYTATETTGLANWTIVQFMMTEGTGFCYPNCDTSTVEPTLNVDDFTCFINEFAQAGILPPMQQIVHYANCDGSSLAPVLNVDDFTCFINLFAQGCP